MKVLSAVTRVSYISLILALVTLKAVAEGPRDKAFQPGTMCSSLLAELSRNPRTRDGVEKVKNDPKLSENGAQPTDPSQATRREFVSMANDPELRKLAVRAALFDMRARSAQLSKALAAASATANTNGTVVGDPAVQVWDFVSIGAGIHDQIFNNIITNRAPGLKGLTIEASEYISPNFQLADAFFRINSSTRPSRAGTTPLPGSGNLNEFPGGPVQVPDLTTAKYPVARTLSEAATLNRVSATADVLFQHRVVAVEDRFISTRGDVGTWPARYRVELTDSTGARKTVYTNLIINASGLGKPKLNTQNQALLDFIAAESKPDPAKPGSPPRVLYFEDAVRYATSSETPYRDYVGQEVAVVGVGDSAKVFIEWLLRVAPEEAYGRDTDQVGYFKSIQWVGQSRKDCKDFIVNVRVRYADVAAGLKNGSIVPVDARLENIEKLPTGRYRLTYRSKADATNVFTQEVDRVMLATGFESESYKLFSQIVSTDANGVALSATNPLENSNAVQVVRGNLPGIGNDLGIAKQLVERRPNVPAQEIYFVGPAAGVLVRPQEQVGVTENVASIYAVGPRTAAFAEIIAARLGTGGNFPRLAAANKVALSSSATPAAPSQVNVPAAPLDRNAVIGGAYSDLYLSARLQQLTEGFTFPANTTVALTIARGANNQTLVFGVAPSLTAESQQAFADAFSRDAELVTLANRFVGTNGVVRATVITKADGTVDLDRSRIEFGSQPPQP